MKKEIRFLRDFTNELEKQRCEELTEKQAVALIAKGLISSIEAEMCTKEKPRRKIKFLNRFSAN